MRLDRDAIGTLGTRLRRGSVLVSATNGKTTTAAIAARIFERAGVALVHNRAGANMAGGIATTLLAAARRRGGIDGELGLFEVDELWLDALAAQLHPRAVLLGNLFRDQLDRYGELEAIAERWAGVLLRVGAARAARAQRRRSNDRRPRPRARRAFCTSGSRTTRSRYPGMAHAADAKHCRRCGAPVHFRRRSTSAISAATAVRAVVNRGRSPRFSPSA